MRNLIVILGDQLNRDSLAFEGLDAEQDAVWIAEALGESKVVLSTKMRSAVFLAGMRQFAHALMAEGLQVIYRRVDETPATLDVALDETLRTTKPQKIVMVAAGEYRLRQTIAKVCASHDVPLEIREDNHFLATHDDFEKHANGRKQLRMEFFYREMRRKHSVLMEGSGASAKPVGGDWNFDHDNRESFGKQGPPTLPEPRRFRPDAIVAATLLDVQRLLHDHPGEVAEFDWPVTRKDALLALMDFIDHRLPSFGQYQDAMWTGEPWLFHSRLSVGLNLKLLHPMEVIRAAESAFTEGKAPLAAVEGFIRQILGWREYVRGVYWLKMPEYVELNALNAKHALPKFFWTGDTDMRCLAEAIGQTLKHGYAHHIQRLMVTGLFTMLYGVKPQEVHAWYLAVYVDAIEWVELPNTLGMSQYGDGGIMASKPYAATGKYIQKMSNYCSNCRYDPAQSTGENACPFTTLYWDFLIRHETLLAKNQRMALQVKNIARLDDEKKAAIKERVSMLRRRIDVKPPWAQRIPRNDN
jgi:deoxyribodipyrimidine photolyase-related protein